MAIGPIAGPPPAGPGRLPGAAERRESTMRFFCYTLGDPNAPMPEPSPEMYSKMEELVQENIKSGVLLATGGFAPLDEAIKVSYADGTYTVLDGPFTEAKELIGGWALIEVRDKPEAVEQTKRFLSVVGGGDTTIRQVFGP
jgi:hypothetical protein